MPIPTFSGLPPYPEFNDVVNKINKLVNELRNLMLNLDTLNVVSLNAKVIEAGTITADKMNVSELSAISANLGHITAGLIEAVQIYGSFIATANGTYPRIELSNTDNLLKALTNATNFFEITPSLFGSPANYWNNGTVTAAIYLFIFNTLLIQSSHNINISPGSGYKINIPNWSSLYSLGESESLKNALDNLSTNILSLNLALSSHSSTLANHESRISALESP